MGKFEEDVKKWAAKAQRRSEFVFKQSVQEVITIMQTPVAAGGNMPVDTGFLRSSLRVRLNSMPTGVLYNPGEAMVYDVSGEEYSLTIASSRVGDTIYAAYLANYAVHQEYGANGVPGRRFVGQAAAQWPAIVSKNVAKARSLN